MTVVLKSLKLFIKEKWFIENLKLHLKRKYHTIWIAEKKTECKNPNIEKTNERKLIHLMKCAVCVGIFTCIFYATIWW